ncbi:ankyrin repeat-containing domain protein [Trichophaea hybrida]|nr:ankyrin repeat-containing domain protein [Trichophaea hybrida]
MVDGLSVAASVAGLTQLAAKVIGFVSTVADAPIIARNVHAEVRAFQAIFDQLQDFITNFSEGDETRKYVDQLIATLTGCVCSFSELDKELESLKTEINSHTDTMSVDKEMRDENGISALHQAASRGHSTTVQLLVEILGVDKEATTYNGLTALHIAASRGDDTIVQLLIETLGFNGNAKTNSGFTALHLTVDKGHNTTVQLLVEILKVDKEAKTSSIIALGDS